MKRLTFILIALMAAFAASADTYYMPHVYIGGRAGVSMAQMSFSPSVRQAMTQGTAGAFTVRYTEEKLFGLVAELGWATRGWKEDFEETPLSYSRSLTYLTLPIMTQIRFGSSRFKTFINLGPQFAYMIGSSIKADFDYNNIASVPDFPLNRQTAQMGMEVKNKFDYGICASLGFEFFILPRQAVQVEGRYYFGLGNIFPSRKADHFSASRNTSIEISLGYCFRIK